MGTGDAMNPNATIEITTKDTPEASSRSSSSCSPLTWYWYIKGVMVFPLGMFYFARALAPGTPEASSRAVVHR